ncbi:MAG: hypothetical protein COS76_01845 [Candidatus Portnoybacteria bacterium CG06_land_8_20_14_3_00_39_12]|uniref:Uncharacterized protein n=2 Tax=Candidatus Portnoyibacteriota TaxID=1817913 RepID=A0A2M7UH28_9BACT|nr:MAG: hypothetical protein AUJ33_03000 [Parcubacteria group bacterium CG1_02_40_25]PIU75248.1 MAG: hypothetical protein COS76_01845 [Candidatus Portnoybacteria bacterium CG06_land_8_20_14_3_00_39_12]PIZ70516.1 MAG: hypothetical protein COY09_02825 [Candidatus Portnoybacteria bacterium CG_4_10_14_0_2_um_filter_39_11]
MPEKEPKIDSDTEKELLEKLTEIVKNIQRIEIHNSEVTKNLEKDDEILTPEQYIKEVINWGNYFEDTKYEPIIFINNKKISENEWVQLTSRKFFEKSGIGVLSWMDHIKGIKESPTEIDSNNFYSAFMPEGKPGRKIFDTEARVKDEFYPDSYIELSKKYAELQRVFPRLVEILFKQGDELDRIDTEIHNKYLNSENNKYIGIDTKENAQKYKVEMKNREEWKKENNYNAYLNKAYVILRRAGVAPPELRG